MVLGYFGKTPVEPDEEVKRICREQLGLEPTDRIPVDINDDDPEKGIEAANAMLREAGLPVTEENTFIAAACREKGIQYLKGEAKIGVRKKHAEETETDASESARPPAASPPPAPTGFSVTVNGAPFEVTMKDDVAIVDGVAYSVSVTESSAEASAPAPAGRPATQPPAATVETAPSEKTQAAKPKPASVDAQTVEAPLPGLVLRIIASAGASIAKGETILVVESMKMETEIHAPVSGTIAEIPVSQGDQVQSGDVLALINR